MNKNIYGDTEQFRALAEAMPQIVWTANPDGGLDFTNLRWHSYSGMTAAESSGWGWANCVHPEDLPRISKIWLNCIQTGETYEVEFRLRRTDQIYRWHLTRAISVEDDNNMIVKWFGTCTDIDDQKRASELLEVQVQTRTEDVKKAHSELKQLSYSLSHELQGPLARMSSNLRLLKARYSDRLGEDADEFIEVAISNGSLVQNMIDGLWMFARIDNKETEKVICDCADILRKACIRLQPLIDRKRAQISYQNLPVAKANEAQLEYLFQQLIENALKYCTDALPVVSVSAQKQDDEWLFAVRDNGQGFDMMDLNRLFKMFQRLDQSQPGIGMGLAVCKKVVEIHGGTIWAKSEPGNGSTFYFTIPVSPSSL